MELKVYECGQEVGGCDVLDEGLYWHLDCRCSPQSDCIVGLYGAGYYLGLPERNGNCCRLRRRISKSSVPGFPTENDRLLLLPRQQEKLTIGGTELTGYLQKQEGTPYFRIPGGSKERHPCMQLCCFFQYDNGFWLIRLDDKIETG